MAGLDCGTLRYTIEADSGEAISSINQLISVIQQAIGVMNEQGNAAKTANDITSTSAEQGIESYKDFSAACEDFLNTFGKVGEVIKSAIGEAVNAGSNLFENIQKTEVVFGENATIIENWANKALDNMGIAKSSALEAAATFGDLGSSMGVANEQNAEMSMNLVQLSADMASFKNISQERAALALQGIYTGEAQSLKNLGIVMTETQLTQYALNEGYTTAYSKMTQNEKVMLRYKYVLSQTGNAQGDFARNLTGVANQSRKLEENIKELAASFGTELQGQAANCLGVLNNVLTFLGQLPQPIKDVIIIVGEAAVAVVGVVTAIVAVEKAITAFSALVATNPMLLTIMAITAAVAALVGGISLLTSQTEKEVKGVDEELSRLKKTYTAQVEVKKTETFDTQLNDITQDMKHALDEHTAYIRYLVFDGSEMRKCDFDAIQTSIDSILKDANLMLTVNAINPNIETKLLELRTKIDNGTFNSEDLQKYYDLLQEINDFFGSDGKCIYNIEVNGTDADVQAGLKEITDKAKELWGLDKDKELTLSVIVDQAKTNLGEIQDVWEGIIASPEKYKLALESMVNAQTASLSQAAMDLGLFEVALIANQVAAGNITMEQGAKAADAVIANTKELTQGYEAMGEAQKAAWAAGDGKAMLEITMSSKTAMDGYAESTRSAAQEMTIYNEMLKDSNTTQEALEIQAIAVVKALGEEAVEYENEALAAKAAYDEVNAIWEEKLKEQAKIIEGANKEYDALQKFSVALRDNGDDAKSAITTLKETDFQTYNTLVTLFGNEETLAEQTAESVMERANTVDASIEELYAEEVTMQADKEAAIKQAQQKFIDRMAELTNEHSSNELTAYSALFSQIKSDEGQSYVERISTQKEKYGDMKEALTGATGEFDEVLNSYFSITEENAAQAGADIIDSTVKSINNSIDNARIHTLPIPIAFDAGTGGNVLKAGSGSTTTGGNTTNNSNITNNITINNPQGTPYENAAAVARAGNQLAVNLV